MTHHSIGDLVLFTFGSVPVTLEAAALSALAIIVLLAAVLLLLAWRNSSARERAASEAAFRAARDEEQMAAILKAQSEMQGRMATMAELFGSRQAELNRAINERLDGMTQRLGTSMSEQTKATHENLTKLQERLAVIDTAQTNIQALAKDVVGLQSILSNKQTRGAFGQGRMETIVADGLPMGAYAFQPTLSNGARPDCTVTMPNEQPALVVDAKFPLEAWNAMRETAGDDNPDAWRQAAQRFRRDIEVHIRDISEKYLIQGETQDTAFMFVPSESIFADIHEKFESVVERAHKARVVIVSPSLLMLSIQVIQAVLKDARMREQAHLIQGEVIRLMEDLGRLDERVRKLQGHFIQTEKDIDLILTSTEKLTKRGAKIEQLDFSAPEKQGPTAGSTERPEASREQGRLKLRAVNED